MNFNKKTLIIEVNVTDEESIPALLGEVVTQLQSETVTGLVRKRDGDEVSWEMHSKQVEV